MLSEEANDAPSGYEPLRTVFAEQLSQRSNQALTSEHVLITSGAQQALFLITQGSSVRAMRLPLKHPHIRTHCHYFNLQGYDFTPYR